MNIKLYKSRVMDTLVVMVDILLVLLASLITKQILDACIGDRLMLDATMFIFVSRISYAVSVVFMLYIFEFYTKTIRSKFENLLSVAIAMTMSTLATLIITFFFLNVVKATAVLYFLLMTIFLILFIGSFKMLLISVEKRMEGTAKLLVIESKDADNSLARKIKYSYLALYESWYIMIDTKNQAEIDELINVTFKQYESIFISPDIPPELRNLFISCAVSQNKDIYVLPDFHSISFIKSETVQFDDTPAFRIKPFGLTKMQRLMKRLLDVSVSLVGIIITLPIMLAVPILIKFDSKGPVIYKQLRVTRNQKTFHVYKFRTMHADAEKTTGAVLATEDDPRITKVGRFLRATRLDELPQFFNVLFGEMSVVGPRPERPVFVEQYKQEVENYDKRFYAKAGLTGLAQVYARYDTTVKDKILYDLIYIKDYSFFKDIKLILLTLKIMFFKESSEGVQEKQLYYTSEWK